MFHKWLVTTKLDSDFVIKLRENLLAYKQYFTQQDMSPDSIILRAKHGSKTVLIDSVDRGTSITFMAKFLHCWAKEQGKEKELTQSLVFHGFEYDDLNITTKWIAAIRNMGFECNHTFASGFYDLIFHSGFDLGFESPYNEIKKRMEEAHYEKEESKVRCFGCKERIAYALGDRASQFRIFIMDFLNSIGFLK